MRTVFGGVFFIFDLPFGQDAINYGHKSVFKALQKATRMEEPRMVTLKLPHRGSL